MGRALEPGELIAGICRRQGSLAQSDAGIRDRLAMVDQSEDGKSAGSKFCHQTSLVSAVGRAAQAVAVSLPTQSFYETEPGHSLLVVTIGSGETIIHKNRQLFAKIQ